MKLLYLSLAALSVNAAYGTVLFDQMTDPSATIIPSSWVAPDGTDNDTYSWDNFLLPYDSTVNEVWWIGGGGPNPTRFTVRFYNGLAAAPDLQPTITAIPESETSADYLKGYSFAGNANQTAISGTSLFQYHVTLPTSLALTGNKVYWVKIEADVAGFPSWGLATATHGRDTGHFRYITGLHMFQRVSGSTAFQLRGVAPEPQGMMGLGVGVAGLIALRSRKRISR